jgi:alkaline phosphatase D
LKTAPLDRSDVLFAWSGDVAGQGYGINLEWGGMRIFKTMLAKAPDFFLHSGDQIYADNPIPPVMKFDNGHVWRNLTTPAKSKVAETLDEFRGNFAYNLLDVNVRRFNAEVPLIVQWDDHEVHNNWFPAMTLEKDDRYTVKSVSLLAERALRAMIEYTPVRPPAPGAPAVYRALRYGPLLDVIVLDERSYRGRNTKNLQKSPRPWTTMLGEAQLAWLKRTLVESKATWKVIASDMPIGLIIRDYEDGGEPEQDGWGAMGGPPRGREIELANLLSFIKKEKVNNVIWLTADVHYAAAHHYHPSRAQFTDFVPFWEFVAGPLNAGSFGPNKLDNTFGPEAMFRSAPEGRTQDLPPSAGFQSFGTVRIDAQTEAMTVTLHDLEGKTLHQVALTPTR